MSKISGLILACVGLSLIGCGGGDGSMDGNPIGPPGQVRIGNTWVYEGRQSLQCGSRGLTTQQSAQKLINGGIDVVQSACGVMTGVAFPAVCGAGTGEILLHEIRTVNLVDAEQRGFKAAATLQNPARGTDYARVDCQTGAPLP
jgi:hypothetical protein